MRSDGSPGKSYHDAKDRRLTRNDFNETTTLGTSGLETSKMGIGADAGVPADVWGLILPTYRTCQKRRFYFRSPEMR